MTVPEVLAGVLTVALFLYCRHHLGLALVCPFGTVVDTALVCEGYVS
jgi:hypothetical protein